MAMAIAALLGEWLCVRRELQEIPLGEDFSTEILTIYQP